MDYQSMVDANSIMAPILFYTYVGVVWFILMQMFVAIITDSYQEIKGNQNKVWRGLDTHSLGQRPRRQDPLLGDGTTVRCLTVRMASLSMQGILLVLKENRK
jgi:hypothetical protein